MRTHIESTATTQLSQQAQKGFPASDSRYQSTCSIISVYVFLPHRVLGRLKFDNETISYFGWKDRYYFKLKSILGI